jgi:hypothetical protein
MVSGNDILHSHQTHRNSTVCGHVIVPGGNELQTAQDHQRFTTAKANTQKERHIDLQSQKSDGAILATAVRVRDTNTATEIGLNCPIVSFCFRGLKSAESVHPIELSRPPKAFTREREPPSPSSLAFGIEQIGHEFAEPASFWSLHCHLL